MSYINFDECDFASENKNSAYERYCNIISAINNLNIDSFMECSWIDTPIISNILHQPDNCFVFLHVIPDNIDDNAFKRVSANINETRHSCFHYFFDNGNLNYENFINENFYSKQEFYLLERIVSLFLLFSLVKFFKK